MPKMQTSFNGLVQLLAKNLYTSSDVFIRELLQNAHDGCQRALAEQPNRNCRIDVLTSEPDGTITFADNGVGMDERDIHEYLSTIGRSGTAAETARLSAGGFAPETIGQFGVGLLSAFVVAERIDVFTRREGETGYHWVSRGGDEYDVSPTADAAFGTEIAITLKKEFLHFLDPAALKRIVRLYADFLSIPIHLNGDGPVNAMHAPWHATARARPDAHRTACGNFLQRRYRDRALLVLPFHLDEPRARGALYITDQPIPGVGTSGTVDLYVRRMCIRLNDGEMLPEWATFVRGIVDADLQPTAARDNVQRDTNYHKLRGALGQVVIDGLMTLRKEDPAYFRKVCEWHHVGIKGMALHDDSFFAAVGEHLPFATNEGMMSLAEYTRRQKPDANGRTPLFFFSSDGDENQFYQVCSANQLLAINAGRFFDAQILERYAEQRHDEVELHRLDHLASQLLYADPAPERAEECRGLMTALRQALEKSELHTVEPQLRAFAPESVASVLLEQPGADVLDRFHSLLETPFVPGSVQDIAAEITARIVNRPVSLLINANNPLVQSLARSPLLDSPLAIPLLLGLYHLALLNSRYRTKAETARRIDGYMQQRLLQSLRLERERDEIRRLVSAWSGAETREDASP